MIGLKIRRGNKERPSAKKLHFFQRRSHEVPIVFKKSGRGWFLQIGWRSFRRKVKPGVVKFIRLSFLNPTKTALFWGRFCYTHRTKQNFVYCLQQAGFFVRVPALGDLWQEPLLRPFDAVFWVWFIGCFLSVVQSRISDEKKFYFKEVFKIKKTRGIRNAQSSVPQATYIAW